MPQVTIAHRQVWVGDQPDALLSGEVHYWRLDPLHWREVLEQVRALGLDMIASCICWDFHQLDAGSFDFAGRTHPRRNLIAFLDLAAELGFRLMLRPGPYIYAEWANAGVPEAVVGYHRLHPDFKTAAQVYIEAIAGTIRPYLATRGGPIVLLQAENEPDPWPHIYETQLGLGTQPGLFQEFLADHYAGDIDALNTRWETDLSDFAAARPVLHPGPPGRGYHNRYLDFIRFRHWYAREAVRWTASAFRAQGIDVPITANAYTLNGIQNWREWETVCDLVGPDDYPGQAIQEPGKHRDFLHIMRYTRAYSRLPYLPELQTGIWDGGQYDNGVLTPEHYWLVGLSALLGGITGWNWYMLVNRENWLMSPINELGRTRPNLYRMVGDLVTLFRALDPPTLEHVTPAAVTVDPLHQTARFDDQSDVVLQALYDADIDYTCFDVATGQVAKPVLFYAGGAWLSQRGQRYLLAYVKAGGNLVLFQNLPLHDDHLRALNQLDLRMPVSVLGAAWPQQVRLALGAESVTLSSPTLHVYDDPPGEPIIAERIADATATGDELRLHTALPVGNRYPVGYRVQHGTGSVIVIGVRPGPGVVAAVHRWLGLYPPTQARCDRVSTALFRRASGRYIVVANLATGARDCTIALDASLFAAPGWTVRDLRSGDTWQADLHAAGQVTAHLQGMGGTVLECTPHDAAP